MSALVVPSIWGPPGLNAAPTFPPGFSVVGTDTGQGPYNLTDFVFLPNGGMLTTGKNGLVTHVDSAGKVTPVGTVPVVTEGDLGLLGLDLATDYATSGQFYAVYVYELATKRFARLSRFTVDNPGAPRALLVETPIIDGIEQNYPFHTIGKVIVDTDGTIWFGMGDASEYWRADPNALRVQNLDMPYGKIFRVNPNGTGVVDNPYFEAASPASWRSRVWAYGFRNPFRFTLHPDGTPYIGDVGAWDREEVDIGVKGGNFGWPCWEGNLKTRGFNGMQECQPYYSGSPVVAPLWEYDQRPGVGSSVTGGEFAWGDAYPEPYANSWFFGEFIEQKIWTLETDGAHGLARHPEAASDRVNGAFATDVDGPVSFRRSPQGEIHYAEIFSGHVMRIRYTAGNRPPTARASAAMSYGQVRVQFFGADSSDPDGEALSYDWDFGDGSPHAFTANPVHDYPAVGRYTATLTVRDPSGATGTATVPVVLDDHNPTLTVNWPAADKRYYVDEPITATASADDAEDSDLDSDDVEWRADIVHCADAAQTSCHTHPGRVTRGATFNQPFPDHGPNVYVRVKAQVRDSVGHVERRTFDARPRLQTLTVTAAAPVPLFVNGEPVPPNGKVTVVAKSRNVVHAWDGVNQVFRLWASNPPTASPIENPAAYTMPVAGDASMRAEFRPVKLDLWYSPVAGGASVIVNVAPQGQPGDAFMPPALTGCRVVGPPGGDNGDGRLAVGETWSMPCNLTSPVGVPEHWVTATAGTLNNGLAAGQGGLPVGVGYRMVATDGGIFSFGEGPFAGSMGGTPLNQPVVGMAATPSGCGYWMVAADGGMFSFGDAGFFGSMGGQPLPAPIVGMAPSPTGYGYWLAGADGSVYPFGDAPDHGSLRGIRLARPIVGMAATPSGNGYWMVASDGGVFSFGDAGFFGSMGGIKLNRPVVGMTPTASGRGYWQVASDGGIFAFGDAPFFGSMGGTPLNRPVVGMATTPSGNGYWQVASDGGIFAFGDAGFMGSMGGTPLNQPVVGMTSAVVARAG